jgi:cell division protein FtsI/penicillin-binding protein 2
MDVTSGDLLGCTSAPSFDPNLFVRGISSRDYGALRDSEFRPLSDKTVQGAYPPGSTIKMSNALAALETGLMDPKGAETVLAVFSAGSPDVAAANIDLSRTYTNAFVEKARAGQ